MYGEDVTSGVGGVRRQTYCPRSLLARGIVEIFLADKSVRNSLVGFTDLICFFWYFVAFTWIEIVAGRSGVETQYNNVI